MEGKIKIGAILGDIIGSRFEFNNIKTKVFELLSPECSFTDDTVMTCAVALALLQCRGDYSILSEKAVESMQMLGRAYPDAGYGERFICWVFSDAPKPYNSFGNGSAMRVSPVGFIAKDVEEAKELSRKVTVYESGGIQVGTQCLKQRDQYPYGSATDSVIK